jgi:hypothetical protein
VTDPGDLLFSRTIDLKLQQDSETSQKRGIVLGKALMSTFARYRPTGFGETTDWWLSQLQQHLLCVLQKHTKRLMQTVSVIFDSCDEVFTK